MSVESALHPQQLNTNWPQPQDFVSEGDDHLRLLKTVLKTTFPNVAGAVTVSEVEINYLAGLAEPVQTQLDARGKITGQTWTGLHVFPATTTVGPLTPTIQSRLAGVASDVQAQLDGKGAVAGQAWTGPHDFTGAAITVPAVAVGDSSNKPATTAFVAATALAASLPGQNGNAGKYLTTDGNTAGWGALDLSAYAPKSNPALSGDVALLGRVRQAATAVPALVIDCSQANYFKKTVSGNSVFTFANVPAGVYGLVLEVVHTAGTVAFPASVYWPGGIEPPRTAGKTHLFFLLTGDGGGTWRANALTNYAG